MIRLVIYFITAFLAISSAAHAKWYQAESDHFVVYANDKQSDVARFSENLERYHAALEIIMNRKLGKPSPSNRVTIFVARSDSQIKALHNGDNNFVAGFYIPRAGGSVAFVQDVRFNTRAVDFSMQILLHEYAHHFLISSMRHAMPLWWQEGAAEYFSSAIFNSDGGISIGRPNNNRAAELHNTRKVPIRQLLDEELYEKFERKGTYDNFYGRAWLLFHYLYFSEPRKGQFEKYSKAIVDGAPPLKAAEAAFGDLDALDIELDKYMKQRTMSAWGINASSLPTQPATIRELSEGEAAMMNVVMRSKAGVDEDLSKENLIAAHEIAAQYPNDAGVLEALAEAEFDAGNDDAAVAAADKAIAIDPNRKNAYVQKGYALFSMAKKAADKDAAYIAAMRPFKALNALENDHPLPLIYHYRSFIERGKPLNENARLALERAAELSPFDQGLWLTVAMMWANEGKIQMAIAALRPIANSPHKSGMSRGAEKAIKQLQKIAEGQSSEIEETDFEEAPQPET